jgi:hypothetical protein
MYCAWYERPKSLEPENKQLLTPSRRSLAPHTRARTRTRTHVHARTRFNAHARRYIHRLPEILARFERVPGRIAQMRRNLECVWKLHWWNRPHGRAFEMTMCVLKARLHNTTPRLDLASCRLFCGTGEPVNFKDAETGLNSV